MLRGTLHEDLSRARDYRVASDRSFGLTLAGVFLAIALWPLLKHGHARAWAAVLCAAFVLVSLARASLLHRANVLWARFGAALGNVAAFAGGAALFYGVVTPVAWIARLAGKDLLRLRRDPAATSYWIERRPPGPAAGSMKQQF